MTARYKETNKVALRSATLVTSFMFLLFLAVWLLDMSLQWWHFPLFGAVVFLFTFFVFRSAIDRFIYNKIRLIFKSLPGFRSSREKSGNGNLAKVSYESVEGINEAVLEWGQRQRIEIEELKKMATYRREFLGNISHELKTPIFNIQGYVLTLLDGGLEDPTINTNYLHRTEKSVNRLIAIVEDLEEISKLESGEVKLNLSTFDALELAKEVSDFLELKALKNNAKVIFENNTSGPVLVKADKKRMRQVFINLIENAVKYGDKDINSVQIRFFDMDEHYLVEVKDNGPGIPDESLPRIFERFYRTDKGRSRDMGGTGLGLAIVKHIIEAHDQTIRVRSKMGQGTIFAFTLPK